MEKRKLWIPGSAEEAARSVLWNDRPWGGIGRGERALRTLMVGAPALLLALAALTVCREAGAIHPLYTCLMAAAVLALALLTRAVGEGRGWLLVLLAGAVGLRVIFILGWTVYPHESCLTGWNLALELACSGPGQWPGLVAAVGGGTALDLPFILYESLLIRLFGPTLAAVQLPGALWGGLSCLLTALVAGRLTGSHRAGLTAGALLACCPTLLFSAGALSWLPLYTALLLTGLWLLICRPLGRPRLNAALAGLAWGLCQALRPGLPIPLLAAGVWLALTLPGRPRKEGLLLRAGCLLGAFLAAALLFGLAESALTGTDVLSGRLAARAAIGLNAETGGQYSGADLPLLEGEMSAGEAAAQRWPGLTGELKLMLRKVRFQFGSYDYQWSRLDQGGALRNRIISEVMHPALQSYMLFLILLALAGAVLSLRRQSRAGLLPFVLLLGYAAAAVLLEVDPVYNGCVIPLMAVWAAAPAEKLAGWTVQIAAPEGGKKRKPLPPALAAVRLVLSVIVYAAMLALILVFFTGNGMFIYEAL